MCFGLRETVIHDSGVPAGFHHEDPGSEVPFQKKTVFDHENKQSVWLKSVERWSYIIGSIGS